MDVPAHLRYSVDHQWIATGDVVRLGITEYAQDALGDVIFVDLPGVGDTVTANDPLGEVESTKSVSDLFAPITGVITLVNDALVDAPQLINQDPYGEGWVCEMRPTDPGAVDALLSAEAYQELTGGQ